uniref:histidine kinase n=1 Tax=Cyanothece sp. (strain PCC 7425 / ATCC 29141) TaxID=395961 RepID=B8HRN3_CYAP4
MSPDLVFPTQPQLDQIINYSPLVVSPETSALEVIGSMHPSHSCALIMAGGQLSGIFTSQDVVKATATCIDLAATSIAEVMTQPVVTVTWSEELTIQRALSRMAEQQVHHLPILDAEHQLLGIITQEQLLQAIGRPEQWKVGNCLQQQLQWQTQNCDQLERVLQASAINLKDMLNSANAAIASVRFFSDHLFEYDYCSAGNAQVFGYSAQEFISNSSLWRSRVHPDDRDQIEAAIANTMAAEPNTLEYRFYRKDGNLAWVSTTYTSRRDDELDCWIVTAISTDITDRKQLELSLQASERKLNYILDNVVASIVTMRVFADRDWEYDYHSAGYERLFGYSDEELKVDKTLWLSRVFPEDRATILMPLFEAFFSEINVTVEYRFYHKDGSLLWISSSYASERIAPDCWIVTALSHDITDRKTTEIALKESEERFRLAVEAARMGTWDWNILTNEVIWSESMEGLMGMAPGSFDRRMETVVEMIHPDDLVRVQAALNNSLAHGADYVIEFRFIKLDGSVRWAMSRGNVLRDGHDRAVRMLGVDVDVTDRKAAELALQESETKFRRLTENVPGMIYRYVVHPDGHDAFTYVSPRCQEIYELDAETILQDSRVLWSMVDPEDVPRLEAGIAISAQHLSPFFVEHRIHTPSGMKWIQAISLPERMENGDLVWDGLIIEVTEHKRLARALQESEERRRLALDLTETGSWEFDVVTGEAIWSDSHYRLMGLMPGELPSNYQTWRDRVHPEDLVWVEAVCSHALATHALLNVEYRVVYPNGTVRWVLNKGQGVYDTSSQAVRMLGVMMDITDRKAAEKALIESEARYRLLCESLPVGIFRNDLQGNNTYSNPKTLEMVGLSFEESLGDGWAKYLHPNDRDRMYAAWSNFVEQINRGEAASYQLELRYLYPNGSLRWVLAQAVPEYNGSGQLTGFVGSAVDITPQKIAEQTIRSQAALIDITSDAMSVRSLDNEILFWNRAAEKIYGWTANEVLGQHATHLLYRDPAQLEPAFQAVLAEDSWQGELSAVTKTGQELTIASRWTLMRNGEGQPEAILIVDTDITEKKQLESQFLRAQRLESIGTLASGMAHDLNNMLTPILASSQLLQKQFPEGRSQEILKIIEANARRGADLIRQVLTFARGTEGKRIPLQVKHLLTEIQQICERTFPKSITIVLDVVSTLSTILADPTQLHQVLMNLCVNARDAMSVGGQLQLRLEDFFIDENYARLLALQSGAYIVITVADTGTGIAPEVLERIFDPFFTTKAVGQGTGLGLSVAEGIIRSHGGIITVESEVGHGSQFKLYLPAATTSPAQTLPEQNNSLGQGELILVVDDEANLLTITQTILEDHNYRVITASNGIAAISTYVQHQHEIRVVLMDMIMPEMDGATTIAVLKKINPQNKIIACSGLSSLLLQDDLSVGINASLAKPYTADELLTIVAQVLR